MEDHIEDLKKGAIVELQYREHSDNKREVWEIALIDKSPIASVKKIEHNEGKDRMLAVVFPLFGAVGAYVMISKL